MRLAVVLCGLFFLLAVGVAAKPQVSIGTSGRFFTAFVGRTANVVLIVRMEVHERNQELEVSCDGVDGGSFVSTIKDFSQGQEQAEIYDIGFSLMPATYRCEAVLKRRQEDGKRKEFASFVEVTVH